MKKRFRDMNEIERTAWLNGCDVYAVEELNTWDQNDVCKYAANMLHIYRTCPKFTTCVDILLHGALLMALVYLFTILAGF